MMTRIFFIVIALLLMVYIYRSVQKNVLTQEESIFWMIGAFVILILGIWPELIILLANFVGIDYAPSLLFLLACAFLVLLALKNSQQISELKEKNKELIQNVALLDKRIRDIEREKRAYKNEK